MRASRRTLLRRSLQTYRYLPIAPFRKNALEILVGDRNSGRRVLPASQGLLEAASHGCR
jgi:hypothetical protein